MRSSDQWPDRPRHGKAYLLGDEIMLADYFGACLVTLGEVIRCDFSRYANVCRWIENMKKLESWDRVNEAHHAFVGAMKGQEFKAL
jgi:glutathione S-transferase